MIKATAVWHSWIVLQRTRTLEPHFPGAAGALGLLPAKLSNIKTLTIGADLTNIRVRCVKEKTQCFEARPLDWPGGPIR